MMFTMSFPAFVGESQFSLASTHHNASLFVASFLSLAANVAVFVYHLYRIKKYKRNVLKEEVYMGLKSFEEIKACNKKS